MNARSSRSHTVFSLRISGEKKSNDRVQEMHGTLHLVDLAGSERLDKSNAVGVQLKEAQAINKSLSALSDVFVALSKKSAHVPYRNSKLTFLLQPCLSGDGKALVIANLAPEASSAHESLCTLRFASMVSSCELGKAVKHTNTTTNPASAPGPAPSAPRAGAGGDEGLEASDDLAAVPGASGELSTPTPTPRRQGAGAKGSLKTPSSTALRRLSKSCDDIAALAAHAATPARSSRPTTPAVTPRGGGLPPPGLKGAARTPGVSAQAGRRTPGAAESRIPSSASKR